MRTNPAPSHPGQAGGPVYVVDGDQEVGRSLKLLLGTLCRDVQVFQTGEEVLSRILQTPPACIIAEVFLPAMTGTDLQKELKARNLKIPVIIMATHADIPLAVEAMRLGAVDFIEKPIIDRSVLARVREVLDSPPSIRIGRDEGQEPCGAKGSEKDVRAVTEAASDVPPDSARRSPSQ